MRSEEKIAQNTKTTHRDDAPLQIAFIRKQINGGRLVTVIANDGTEYSGTIVAVDRFSVLLTHPLDDGSVEKHLFFKHGLRAIRRVKLVKAAAGANQKQNDTMKGAD